MMSRPHRHTPEGGAMVEVTNRTIQERFLLRPSRELNEIALGVVGRAQRLYDMERDNSTTRSMRPKKT